MVNIAMIGVGAISGIYLQNITNMFKEIQLIGVCDLIRERAENARKKWNVPKLYETMYDAFKDPEVDIVLNLTRPYEHYGVTKAALEAGKHVYSEKPLAADWDEGRELVAIAEAKGLMLGGAPDTFLGAGIQTCRKLIDEGEIGDVVGAAAFMICHGHETWHPDPAFYYKRGGGPMMDMGPYYLTALINLLGGVKQVSGVTKTSFPTRLITSQPHNGEVVTVDVPTYVTGTLLFDSGAVGTIFTTFDVYYPFQARLEVYGSKGTLFVPDPNGFGGPVKIFRPTDKEPVELPLAFDYPDNPTDKEPVELPLAFDYPDNSRALGLADMAKALETGRFCRTDYKQTRHVLELLTAFEKSSDAGAVYNVETKYERKPPMKVNPVRGILD